MKRVRPTTSESRLRTGRRVRLDDVIAPRDRAAQRLADLYRVGRWLSMSVGRERATQGVLAVIAETISMRSAILVHEARPHPRMTAWLAGPIDPIAFTHLRESARSAYADLVGVISAVHDIDATHILPSLRPSAPADASFTHLVLPLAAESGVAAGVLQLEVSVPIDEADLAYVYACATQLATVVTRRCKPGPRRSEMGRAVEAVRHRDDLMSLVAHDLKGPLGAILITADSLLAREGNVHTRELSLIRRSGKRMLHLIADLLDVASIDARHLGVELRDEPAGPLIWEAEETLRPTATSRQIALELDIPIDLPDVRVDRNRTHQILANLVGNALKFTDPGGVVRVVAAVDAETVRVSVTDTGHGIEEDNLAHVFERFWQAPADVHHGTGLGLYIVKSLVEAQGGTISVRSVVGVGTTFAFTLPLAKI